MLLAFISFFSRIVLVLKNRSVFDVNYEDAKITELFFNKLRAKESSQKSHTSIVMMLNVLLYLGVGFLAIAGIVFFVTVYSFPK
jgi:hypothetical protein